MSMMDCCATTRIVNYADDYIDDDLMMT